MHEGPFSRRRRLAAALWERHLLRKDSTPLKDEGYAGFSSRYACLA